MREQFSRTEMLIGRKALEKLHESKVAIFGIGGVGSFVVEGLARAGVGQLVLVDSDQVSISNLNRQLLATYKTIGRPKVEVMRERILEINPKAQVTIYEEFYLPEKRESLIKNDYDYLVDAVDTVTAKIDLVMAAQEKSMPIISSMGAGNKLDPTKFQVADIYDTSVCPLAKVMRRELRKRNIKSLKVVYSREEPIPPISRPLDGTKNRIPASISFVPSVAGLIVAGQVVKDLMAQVG